MTTKFEEYLEEAAANDKYIVATEHGIGIDLGKHAQKRGDSRLHIDKDILINIGKKLADVFDQSKPDGLFGFYSRSEHVSGIFRFFKSNKIIKFITIFPNKKVQFFNNIDGAIVFNESHDSSLVEGIPLDEVIVDLIEI